MKQLIDSLIQTVKSSNICDVTALKNYITHNANQAKYFYKKDYPVAIANEKRVSNTNKQAVRNVDLIVLDDDLQDLDFVAKRDQDFWKRLQSVQHIQAMISLQSVAPHERQDDFIETSLINSKQHQWSVETQLRDAMRANKENKDLGAKPFIILLCTPNTQQTKTDHLTLLLQHYFNENVTAFNSQDESVSYYLAYNKHMSDIGMRYFYKFDK